MGKKKIYEIGKELDLDNKVIIEYAKTLNPDIKGHLSSVTDDEYKNIVNHFSKGASKTTTKTKKADDNKTQPKEPVKTTGQVIIRREVIVKDERRVPNNEVKKVDKTGIGFNQVRNKDYNIVYRNKANKPLTINELFGLKPKKEEKPVSKEPVVPKTESQIKTESTTVKPEVKPVQPKPAETKTAFDVIKKTFEPKDVNAKIGSRPSQDNKGFNNRATTRPVPTRPNNGMTPNRPFERREPTRTQNGYQPNGQMPRTPFNRPQRPGFNRPGGVNPAAQTRPQNTGFNNFRPSNRVAKEDITEIEDIEKDSRRAYSNKMIDKQKANSRNNLEERKRATRNKRGEDNYSEEKIRDLKQANKLSNMFEDQEGGMLDYYDMTSNRGAKKKKKRDETVHQKQKIFELKEISIPKIISVKDLAQELKKTSNEVIKKLFDLGIMANINQDVDFDTAYLAADAFGVTAKLKEEVKDEDILFDDSEDKEEDLVARPPVVVVMGHVDHGKTSLLDAIKNTNVIEGEAGGITQHMGAYKVSISGRDITFIDTPGHEAFTSMRARGAQITDIAILVVAADDGVMPQTIEAINHAKAADIPIIVAINKIDLPGANVDKIKQDLMTYELVPEEWGGDTICVPISAKKNINIENLLEMVLLVADMKNLRANPNRQAKGTVIEAKLDKAKGPTATVLVQRGTLNVGDTIILGSSIGKIRTMKDEKGKSLKSAGPSTPVAITGLSAVPEAGDIFYEVKNEKVAKHLIEKRRLEQREKAINSNDVVTLDNLFDKMKQDDLKQLSLIVKTDVQGTAEAMKSSLEKLTNDEVRVKVIHSGAGAVTESDVQLAKAAGAIIIAFDVRPVSGAKALAEKENVEIKQYSVIYEAIEEVQEAMKGMLAPKYIEKNIGELEVRQVFKVSNVGTIAGCFVLDGKAERNAQVRVIREETVIHDGKLVSLKRFKDDAKEVTKGFECGLQIEDYNDIKEGDHIEVYIKEEVKR